jgi:hypothetical protein
MVADPPSPTSSDTSGLSGASHSKIRLRVHYNGDFKQVTDGVWKYKGGEIHHDSVSQAYTYSEVVHRWNEKAKEDFNIKYLPPGEVLDPDMLISVTDDSDLQEMFEEYDRALKRSTTPIKSFRLSVYLLRAYAEEEVFDREMTEELEQEGEDFFSEPGLPFRRISGHSILEVPSSNGSNASMSCSSHHAHGDSARRLHQQLHFNMHHQGMLAEGMLAETMAEQTLLDAFQQNVLRGLENNDPFGLGFEAEKMGSGNVSMGRTSSGAMAGTQPQHGNGYAPYLTQDNWPESILGDSGAGNGDSMGKQASGDLGAPASALPSRLGSCLGNGDSPYTSAVSAALAAAAGGGQMLATTGSYLGNDDSAYNPAVSTALAAAAGGHIMGNGDSAYNPTGGQIMGHHNSAYNPAGGYIMGNGDSAYHPVVSEALAAAAGGPMVAPTPSIPSPLPSPRRLSDQFAKQTLSQPPQLLGSSHIALQPTSRQQLRANDSSLNLPSLSDLHEVGAEDVVTGPWSGAESIVPKASPVADTTSAGRLKQAAAAEYVAKTGRNLRGWNQGMQAAGQRQDALVQIQEASKALHMDAPHMLGRPLHGGWLQQGPIVPAERYVPHQVAAAGMDYSFLNGPSPLTPNNMQVQNAAIAPGGLLRDALHPVPQQVKVQAPVDPFQPADPFLGNQLVARAASPYGFMPDSPFTAARPPMGNLALAAGTPLGGMEHQQGPGMHSGVPGVQQQHQLLQQQAVGAGSARSTSLTRASSGSLNSSETYTVTKDKVQILKTLGEGAFGEVSLAYLPTFGKVAVKWLKAGKAERHVKNFLLEGQLLARLSHPNVLRFYGFVTDPASSIHEPCGILTEYVRGGSLAAYIRAQDSYLSLRKRCELALKIVSGLSYLHLKGVVHFDLKPDNLLLETRSSDEDSETPDLKVADFGLAKIKWQQYVSGVQDLRGTLPYMAPELVADSTRVTEKADVWSVGMVMWEMLTREVPFQNLNPQQIISGLMMGSLKPVIPAHCEPEWRTLMEACWNPCPSDRPTCQELVDNLEQLLRVYGWRR